MCWYDAQRTFVIIIVENSCHNSHKDWQDFFLILLFVNLNIPILAVCLIKHYIVKQ